MQRKRAPKLAKPTPEQAALATEIQKRWVDPSQYDDCTMAIHISHALAQVIDGISKNAPPPKVLEALAVLRFGYLTLFGDQHMQVLVQLIGDSKTVQQVMNHANGKSIVTRIFKRVGQLFPGMAVPDIDIADILAEEGFSA